MKQTEYNPVNSPVETKETCLVENMSGQIFAVP